VVPTIDNLLDAQRSLLAANASLDTACWFMHPDMFTRLRKIREGSGTGTYMLMNGDAGIADGAPTGPGTTFRLLGVPVCVSTQVPGAQAGGKILLTDMNQVAVGRATAHRWACSPRPSPTPTSCTCGWWPGTTSSP
jgi:HK97 family phage major capsid protein